MKNDNLRFSLILFLHNKKCSFIYDFSRNFCLMKDEENLNNLKKLDNLVTEISCLKFDNSVNLWIIECALGEFEVWELDC